MDHPAGGRVESRVETAASTGSMYYDESWPDNIVLSRAYGSPRCPRTGKRTTGPFSPPSASSAKAWCSQPATRRRPRPSPQACGMRRPPTPDGSTPPHGTSSTYGPSQMAVNHCPQNPKQSPSTSAAWQLTAGPWPPSRWPAPPSPTPMPPRGPRKAITPPAIRSWPKRSRAGGIRRQRPSRPARLSPRPWHASGRPPNL